MAKLSSGRWHGFYEQDGLRYPQTVQLELADGVIRGDGVDGIGAFSIRGEYRRERGEVRMGWIKTYERAHSVLYLGVLRGTTLSGTWSLDAGPPEGSFALLPPDVAGVPS